jgi:TerC family integral membrane protein
MSPSSALAAAEPAATALPSIGTPTLWAITIAAVVLLLVVDFVITRRPHEVSMREAVGWSAFYIAIPLGFGVWIWQQYGGDRGVEYYTGYLVEKSLSVDNLFVFLLLLTAFAVPRELQQRVLLIGVAGALVLRGIFIALGAQLIASWSFAFLLFGAVLLVTAVKVLRDAMSHDEASVDIGSLRTVRVLRRLWPVTETYAGTRMTVRQAGRRALTPLALVVVAILGTDLVFAIDSVPAVYGITGDPYLVFATNAFALLGLRALYFVVEGALGSLRHLGFGLAAILAFIGVKLVLHWAHGVWAWVPEVPTLVSLGVIVGILALATTTSILANRRDRRRELEQAALADSTALREAEMEPVDG